MPLHDTPTNLDAWNTLSRVGKLDLASKARRKPALSRSPLEVHAIDWADAQVAALHKRERERTAGELHATGSFSGELRLPGLDGPASLSLIQTAPDLLRLVKIFRDAIKYEIRVDPDDEGRRMKQVMLMDVEEVLARAEPQEKGR